MYKYIQIQIYNNHIHMCACVRYTKKNIYISIVSARIASPISRPAKSPGFLPVAGATRVGPAAVKTLGLGVEDHPPAMGKHMGVCIYQ